MNVRHIHAQQHGYSQPGAVYYEQDAQGEFAPPGYAFNQDGDLVQLPFEPWSQGPQIPWEAPENPDYLEFAQGLSTIEAQPNADPRLGLRYGKQGSPGHVAPVSHEDVALVPQSAYLEQNGDVVPQQDEGTRGQAIFDAPASPVRTRYILSKEITGYVQVEAPLAGTNSPLQVVPLGDPDAVPPVPPFGGAVALGGCQFGHKGDQRQMTFDVLPGGLVKVPTISSFLRMTGRIAPRYFASVDTGVSPNVVRTYLLFPGGPPLTNDQFSDLPPNIMELQGSGPGTIVAAGASGNPVNFAGWPAQGFSTTPSIDSLPVRIFRGSVLSSAIAPASPSNRSRIPIPNGASGAILVGGFYDPARAPASVPVTWVQNLDTGATVGPFASDTEEPVPILQGAVSIDVFGGASAAAGDVDIYYSMIYFLNV